MRSRLAVVLTAVVCSIGSLASAAVYNYVDTTFVNPDWVGVKLADTSVPPATFVAGQASPGGSAILPGPQTPDYRRISHTYGSPPNGAIIVSHEGVNFDWNPLPSEVAVSVDYSYDLNYFEGPQGAVGFAPAIFQGGNVYRSAYDNIFGPLSGWTRFGGTGLPIASFLQIDTSNALTLANSPNPALAMSFGFVSANSANGPSTKFSGLDDYRFTLNTRLIPEPASMSLIAGTTVLLRRRRRD